jgi:dTDP-4-dehydrorhamnose reductase
MRTILIGAGGQLGTALTVLFKGRVVPVGRDMLDMSDATQIRRAIPELKPELVINASAYNFVDRAEDEPDQAYAVNATGPRVLAETCSQLGVPLVHVSTDYVFGGVREPSAPYFETDSPSPNSQYSRSKREGEEFVQAECPRHFVVRTCGLYGKANSPGKGNFVQTMLRLGRERGAVSVVDDQTCTPTAAVDLAAAIGELVPTRKFGLYHATNAGQTTWCGFAKEIFRQAGMNVAVTPITTAQFKAKAARPSYSVLDGAKLAGVIGHAQRPWQAALADYLKNRD